MLVRKTVVAALEAGKIYVAFSGKSKLLSDNGDKGVFVRVEEVVGKDVKITIMSSGRNMTIKNLDERADAWIYSPDDSLQFKVNANVGDKASVTFTERLFNLFNGKALSFDSNAVYKHERDDEHKGQTFYRFRAEDEKWATLSFKWLSPDIAPEWRIPRAQRMGIGAVEIKLPPKPVSAEEEALIELLGAALKEFNENKIVDCVASFVKVNAEGKIVKTTYRGPCHWDLKEGEGSEYVISAHPRNRSKAVPENVEIDYINYLVTVSPFADAFIIKDAEWILENGYILTGNVSAQMMAGACMATRQVQEHPSFVMGWWGLMMQGIPADVAFVMGVKCSESGGKKYRFAQGSTGHCQFNVNRLDDKALINLFDHKAVNENKKPYKECNDYNGVDNMWGTGDASKVFTDLLSVGGKEGKYGREGISLEDACEQAADIIEDWMKKVGI